MASKAVIQSLRDQEKILQEQIEVFKSVQKGEQLCSLAKDVVARVLQSSMVGLHVICSHVLNSSRVLFRPEIQKCATTKGQLDTQLNENKTVKEVGIHPCECACIFILGARLANSTELTRRELPFVSFSRNWI